MKQKLLTAVLLLILLLPAASPLPAQGEAASCQVELVEPRPGQQVGSRIAVFAMATLPADHHLWVFARRIDFEPDWWPQGEMSLKSEIGKWSGFATIGEPRDIGWKFDVAVAVFAEKEHLKLREYLRRAVEHKHWGADEMPAAACPPAMVRITKARE